jgi:hypothetical protein
MPSVAASKIRGKPLIDVAMNAQRGNVKHVTRVRDRCHKHRAALVSEAAGILDQND